MADKITLHGVKDVRGAAGTAFARVSPKRGGDTHNYRQWWSEGASAVYVPCTVFKVTRGAGDLLLAVPADDSSRLTIVYDGANGFTFFNYLSIDRIGVFNAADGSFIEEYVLPHIVGGSTMKRTVGTMPSGGGGGGAPAPAPVAPTIGTVNVTKSGSTASGAATEVTLAYSMSVTGTATAGTTNLWSVSPATGVVIADPTDVNTDITLPVGGPYTVTCTVTNAGASDSPQSGTDTVTVS
jgi:hypothetical protein